MTTTKKNPSQLGRIAAVLACAAAIAAGIAPASASAHAPSGCGAKTIAVKSKGAKTVRVTASLIKVEGGATCAQAYGVIRAVVLHKKPKGWAVSHGNFKVPQGLTPYLAVNGHKKVKFALVGS